MAGAGRNRQRKERKAEKGREEEQKETPSPQEPSAASTSPPQRPTPPGRYDGNRDPRNPPGGRPRPTAAVNPNRVVATRAVYKNLDLGLRGSFLETGSTMSDYDMPPRPKETNNTGRPAQVTLNSYNVEKWSAIKVYQWDVAITKRFVSAKTAPRALIKRLWTHKRVQQYIDKKWIFDGNKIAYSLEPPKKPEKGKGFYPRDLRREKGQAQVVEAINLDLDEDDKKHLEEGSDEDEDDSSNGNGKNGSSNGNGNGDGHRKDWVEGRQPDVWNVKITFAKMVDLHALQSFLSGQLKDLTNPVKEAMAFLDHLLREKPSQEMTIIKRNFFSRGQENRVNIGNPVEAFKGVYAAIRMVYLGVGKPGGLSINVDVANTAFWEPTKVNTTVRWLIRARDDGDAYNLLKRRPNGEWSAQLRDIDKRLRKIQVICEHRDSSDRYIIDGVIAENAFEKKFELNGRETSVFEFFQNKYGHRLSSATLPLLKTTKRAFLPMEMCRIEPNQRYPFKLDERQTSQMIKFAATYPNDRWRSIQNGLKQLNWPGDTYHQAYGLKLSTQPTRVTGKILPNPKVAFQNEAVDPKTFGRWDLRGKKFHGPHPKPLQSWGVMILPGRDAISPQQAQAFIRQLVQSFIGHGGKVVAKEPPVLRGQGNPAKCVEDAFFQTGNKFKKRPELLVFIVPTREAATYNRIKKSADCRFGIVSQVLQSQQVAKNNLQYASNVCMKINAKLGGYTAVARGLPSSDFKVPTMLIGADVSHAAPGSDSASVCAITMSWDRTMTKYAVACQTNEPREEMIAKRIWDDDFKPLYQAWRQKVAGNRSPTHVIYFRDGVSEGQYAQVLQFEYENMKRVMTEVNPKEIPKFTVVVGTKRHHIRFFPDKSVADKNINPLPGTLIETGITNPFEWDFFLCSHSAIKGTARPVHYHVLKDDKKMSLVELQNMIYEHSYQYVRSTTPVSLHPAIYYAHLASNRATSHYDEPTISSGDKRTKTGTAARNEDIKPLLKMEQTNEIGYTMWYV